MYCYEEQLLPLLEKLLRQVGRGACDPRVATWNGPPRGEHGGWVALSEPEVANSR
jgi:hypothetical protein